MNALDLIAEERRRQVTTEGFSALHDDNHDDKELEAAAIAYLHNDYFDEGSEAPVIWPFEDSWFKSSTDPIRNLVKAGALIVAEIERRQRQYAGRRNS